MTAVGNLLWLLSTSMEGVFIMGGSMEVLNLELRDRWGGDASFAFHFVTVHFTFGYT